MPTDNNEEHEIQKVFSEWIAQGKLTMQELHSKYHIDMQRLTYAPYRQAINNGVFPKVMDALRYQHTISYETRGVLSSPEMIRLIEKNIFTLISAVDYIEINQLKRYEVNQLSSLEQNGLVSALWRKRTFSAKITEVFSDWVSRGILTQVDAETIMQRNREFVLEILTSDVLRHAISQKEFSSIPDAATFISGRLGNCRVLSDALLTDTMKALIQKNIFTVQNGVEFIYEHSLRNALKLEYREKNELCQLLTMVQSMGVQAAIAEQMKIDEQNTLTRLCAKIKISPSTIASLKNWIMQGDLTNQDIQIFNDRLPLFQSSGHQLELLASPLIRGAIENGEFANVKEAFSFINRLFNEKKNCLLMLGPYMNALILNGIVSVKAAPMLLWRGGEARLQHLLTEYDLTLSSTPENTSPLRTILKSTEQLKTYSADENVNALLERFKTLITSDWSENTIIRDDSGNEVSVCAQTTYFRKALSELCENSRNEKIKDAVYDVLIALAKFKSFNLVDPISLEDIQKPDAVFLSTGHQFDEQSLKRYVFANGYRQLKNPHTMQLFSIRDRKRIVNATGVSLFHRPNQKDAASRAMSAYLNSAVNGDEQSARMDELLANHSLWLRLIEAEKEKERLDDEKWARENATGDEVAILSDPRFQAIDAMCKFGLVDLLQMKAHERGFILENSEKFIQWIHDILQDNRDLIQVYLKKHFFVLVRSVDYYQQRSQFIFESSDEIARLMSAGVMTNDKLLKLMESDDYLLQFLIKHNRGAIVLCGSHEPLVTWDFFVGCRTNDSKQDLYPSILHIQATPESIVPGRIRRIFSIQSRMAFEGSDWRLKSCSKVCRFI